jgi:2-dehydro-3-deoxyglucarate aldolase
VQEAEKVVIQACMKAGKSCGTQIAEFDSAGVERALAMGYTFIIASSDLFVLDSWARSAQATMQKFQK